MDYRGFLIREEMRNGRIVYIVDSQEFATLDESKKAIDEKISKRDSFNLVR